MFSVFRLAEALQGGPETDEEEDEVEDGHEAGEGDEDEEGDASDGNEQDGGPQLSLWGVATALTATVKARTTQVLSAVQEVDWREELEAFQQGAKEDAEAVGKGADVVMHRAKEAAEQLPGTLEQLPVGAATLQARAEAAGAAARARAGRGFAGLAGLGSKLVLGTHDLLEQISHAVQNEMSMIDDNRGAAHRASSAKAATGQGRYSRFDADVAAMQRDSSTYCDEPEDVPEFEAWLAGFDLAARRPDVDRLIADNTFMSELQARIVPLIVEYDAFWTRYFYRLHKLEQKHRQFLQLAQRAAQPEEEVGWSDDDEAAAEGSNSAAAPAAGVGAAASGSAPSAAPAAATQSAAAEQGEEEAAAVLPAQSGAGQQEGQSARIPALAGSTGQQGQGAAHRPTASSDGSATAASSDSDHWQVVRSPRQEPPPAAVSEEQEAPLGVGGAPAPSPSMQEPAAAAPADAVARLPATAPVVPSPPAAEAAATAAAEAQSVAAVQEEAGEDGELSDWGDDDEAALTAAAATAPAGKDGGAEDWGSDWE